MGQKRRFDPETTTSGLPLSTDILRVSRHVSNVPISDIVLVILDRDGQGRTFVLVRRQSMTRRYVQQETTLANRNSERGCQLMRPHEFGARSKL
jgi:hypothetical protein